MTGEVAALLAGLPAPPIEGQFHVRRLPGGSAFYVARHSSGSPALLIRARGAGRTVPLRLAGIEAIFGMACRVAELGEEERAEVLTAIVCTSREPGVEGYFASVAGMLAGMLEADPELTDVVAGIGRMVDLFQRLKQPPRRSVAGVVGELIVILSAADAVAAVSAWRSDPDERFDFCAGLLRLEAKASTTRRRLHSLSLEQAEPPEGTVGLLASVLVEQASGGFSVGEAVERIEGRLIDHNSILRLRSIIADTLGSDLPLALAWRFDLQQALASLLFFDLRQIPAIRGPLPSGVSGVRFTTDLSNCSPLGMPALASITSEGILPP